MGAVGVEIVEVGLVRKGGIKWEVAGVKKTDVSEGSEQRIKGF